MFERPIVFVLGAGASHEAGLPVGAALAQQICAALDIKIGDPFGEQITSGDKDLFFHLKNNFPSEINEYLKAAWRIKVGLPLSNSIDDFLDIHKDDSKTNQVGKTVIAKRILEAERESKLYISEHQGNNKLNYSNLPTAWYLKFMKMLGRGTAQNDIKRAFENVSFIIFNYDRCLEHFLLHSLREAADIILNINIIHPYGSVDTLPLGGGRGTPFGGGGFRLSANYTVLAQSIRTYTEQMSDKGILSKLKNTMEAAETVVFLGFAYHPQNMKLLWPDKPGVTRSVFGTAVGMSPEDAGQVTTEIVNRFSMGNPRIHNGLDCSSLFDHFARSLPA